MIRALIPLLLLTPAAVQAEERRISIGSFERIRLSAPFEVTVTAGTAPGATVIADRSQLSDIDVHVEGQTLVVRRQVNGPWGPQTKAAANTPVRILVGTPRLSSVAVLGGGRIAVTRLAGTRLDLSATGTSAITVADVQGDQLAVQLVGEGKVAVAGRVPAARLLANGAGTIDAAGLDAGDLFVRLDGLGTIRARARFTATVTSTGLGTVTVAGRPKCRVTAEGGAPVACGTGN